jgi:hypothetical protein
MNQHDEQYHPVKENQTTETKRKYSINDTLEWEMANYCGVVNEPERKRWKTNLYIVYSTHIFDSG